MLTAQRTGNTMGAEVCGADLSVPMDDATFLLYSIQVPKIGGNTLFADQVTAYDDLPESTKTRIDLLVGIHLYGNRDDLDLRSRTVAYPPDERQKLARGISVIRHPLVRRHPLHGPQSLVCGVWNLPWHRRDARG
jgi:taurine dioxygenase